jgi:chromosome segregation ATPase
MESPRSVSEEQKWTQIYTKEVLSYTQEKLQKQAKILEERSNQILHYEKSIADLVMEKQELERKLAFNEDIQNELRTKVTMIENDIQNFGNPRSQPQSPSEEDNVRVYSLAHDNTGLPKNLINSKERDNHRGRFSSITEEGYNLKEIMNLQVRIEELQEEVAAKDSCINEVTEELESFKQENTELVQRLEALQREVDLLRTQQQEIAGGNQQLTELNTAMEVDNDQEKIKLREVLTGLEQENDRLREDLTLLGKCV